MHCPEIAASLEVSATNFTVDHALIGDLLRLVL
jgi:hypothetical protein